MKENSIISYDGSFEGWLTGVFDFYEYKMQSASIQHEDLIQSGLFASIHPVHTDTQKASRVWTGINRISKVCAQMLFKAYLSEINGVEDMMLHFAQIVFEQKCDISKDFGNPTVLSMSKIQKQIQRESHRMEAFVRFRLTKDNIYFATIEPDFNVIPLITSHFKERYADQKWIIYDVQRKYGIYYNLKDVETISLDNQKTKTLENDAFTESEMEFQALWKDYFKATGIAERKNTKLHLQHVPKRYWKYLSEKNID